MNPVTEYPGNSQQLESLGKPISSALNVGAVAIEQERAIAEARGQMQLAKMFPRSESQALADLLEVCKSREFAASAFYTVPNRGSGPSIRFAEEVARVYGNFQFGHRELSRGDGRSEIEVYAWDVERNNRSTRQITVEHVMDSKSGPKKLRDQADIDNRIANVASKQMRGRILALLPKHLVSEGIAACKRTLTGGSEEPMMSRVSKMLTAFGKFGVTNKMLSDYLGHQLDDVTLDELVDLTGVFNALKEGGKASEYFGKAKQEVVNDLGALAAQEVAQKPQEPQKQPAAGNQSQKTEPKPEPAPVVAADSEQAIADASDDGDMF